MKILGFGRRSDLFRQAMFLTLCVWGSDVLLFVLPYMVGDRAASPGTAVTIGVFWGLGIPLSLLIYAHAATSKQQTQRGRLLALAPTVLASAAVVGLGDLFIATPLRESFDGVHASLRSAIARSIGQGILGGWMLALLAALYMMIIAMRAAQEHERQLADARAAALAAEAQASAARLAALRYQLNPHFLFNTLNAVSSSVITGRNDEAESMLARLAEFLRLTLAADPQAIIPLEDELATLQAYLEIESVRFRDRLGVEFSCPNELRNALVPSFVLQPLIENAIKHGVAPTSRPVTIRLEASRDGDDLVVIVEDDGDVVAHNVPGAHRVEGMGVGLTNVRQRLEVLYGARGVLQAAPRERGFLVLLRIPLRLEVVQMSKVRAA